MTNEFLNVFYHKQQEGKLIFSSVDVFFVDLLFLAYSSLASVLGNILEFNYF